MDLKRIVPGRHSRRHKQLVTTLCVALVAALLLGLSLVSLALAATPAFPDVPASHPYYTAITDLATRGIVGGYEDGTFGPQNPIQRQQFAKMIVLTGGYPVSEADVSPFVDVPVGGPGTLYPDNYIAVAAAHHLTVGKMPTQFDPYADITRYQVVTMVVRMILDLRPDLLVMPPSGYRGTGGWDGDPLHGPNAAVAEYNGLLAGLDLSALDPYGNMTRGETAQVLHNALIKLQPVTTTTTLPPTTTSGATTTTTAASTTTTSVPTTSTSGSTTTTVPAITATASDYSIAGVEQSSIVLTVRDQFGNPLPLVTVYLWSDALEGAGLTLMGHPNPLDIGKTDMAGTVGFNWSQATPGAWGVEQVTAHVNNNTPEGITKIVATIQWVYDDRGTDYISAVAGQSKVTVAPGSAGPLVALWSGDVLYAYRAPAGTAIGSGLYTASTGRTFSVGYTWHSGDGFYVGAASTNIDGEPNWMYNVVP